MTTEPNPAEARWNSIRAELAHRMSERKISQRGLAEKAGVAQSSLSFFLAGKRATLELDTLAPIAAALGTTVAALSGEADAGGADETGLVGLTHAQLVESLRNPRKTIAPEALVELAASIERDGVLQNLVVSKAPPSTPGVHCIVAGARRWHAVGMLVREKRQINVNGAGIPAADYRIPCRVIDAEPVEIMTIAVTENLQREDLSAMEEADAFAWLRAEAKWSTAAIAERIGRTQRFVQRRLALVDKLDDSVKTALRDGEITFVQAEALAVVAKEEQAGWVDAVKSDGDWTAADIRREVLEDLHPVKDAIFDLALYTGEIVDGDPDDPDDRYFADTAQFIRLQHEAAAATVETLKAEWAWAALRDAANQGGFSIWECQHSDDRKKAGAIVYIRPYDHVVEIHTGLIPPARGKLAAGAASSKGGTPGMPKRHFTDAHLRRAKNVKTAVLQDAVLRNPGAALRLCVLGLLGADEVRVGISQGDSLGNNAYGPATLVESRERFLDLGGNVKKHQKEHFASHPRLAAAPLGGGYWGGALDPVETWIKLNAMSDAEVLQYLAVIVAGQTGTWNGYQAELGDSALAAHVAADLGVDMRDAAREQLRDEAYLKSAGKQHLAEIATDLRCQVKDSHTGKQLRGFIADALLLADEIGYVPRELRWGGATALPVAPAAKPKKNAGEVAKQKNDPAKAAAALEKLNARLKNAAMPDPGDDDSAVDALADDEDVGDRAEEDTAPALRASGDDMPEIPAFLRRA